MQKKRDTEVNSEEEGLILETTNSPSRETLYTNFYIFLGNIEEKKIKSKMGKGGRIQIKWVNLQWRKFKT